MLLEIYILYQRRKTGRESRNSNATATPSHRNSNNNSTANKRNDDNSNNNNNNNEEQENINTTTSPLIEKQHAWTAMMGSGFHLSYDNAHKVTLRCFTKETLKTGAKRSRGTTASLLGDSNLSPSSKDMNDKIETFLNTLDAKNTPRLPFSVNECLPYIQPIFHALHLVYEDLKLSTLT